MTHRRPGGYGIVLLAMVAIVAVLAWFIGLGMGHGGVR